MTFGRKYKADKSIKGHIWLAFGEKTLMDKIWLYNVWANFSIQLIIRFFFVFFFLLLEWIWDKNTGLEIWASQFLPKTPVYGTFCVTTNRLCPWKFKKITKKSSTTTILLCLSGSFMLTSAHMSFYVCLGFLFLSADELLQFMLIIVTKISQNDLFWGDGLSSWSFHSCQKARCDILDLSVLYRPPLHPLLYLLSTLRKKY